MYVCLGSPQPRRSPVLLHPTPHCHRLTFLQSIWVVSLSSPQVFNGSPLSADSRTSLWERHGGALSLSLSRSCTLVKSKCSGPPKCVLSTLVSASSCSLSIFVKILLPKILSSPRWASRVLQPRGRMLTALRLPLGWGPSSCCNAVCLLSPAALPPTGLWVSTVPTRPGRAQVQGVCLLPYPFPQQPSIFPAGGRGRGLQSIQSSSSIFLLPAHSRANCVTFCICGFLSLPLPPFFLFKYRALELAWSPGRPGKKLAARLYLG